MSKIPRFRYGAPRLATISHEYSYGVCTNKHDSATVALRIRPRPITTTIRHECFKQFKTSVALPWSFGPESSRFTTIRHGSTTNHHGTPRYTTILQIVANRSGTVAKNRECVNGALRLILFWFCYDFLNVPVNNFSVISGRSHRTPGIYIINTSTSCSRTEHGEHCENFPMQYIFFFSCKNEICKNEIFNRKTLIFLICLLKTDREYPQYVLDQKIRISLPLHTRFSLQRGIHYTHMSS